MKEAIIHAGPRVELVDSPIPKPRSREVVIRVVVSGSNPKDWKGPEWFSISINQGDDIAGIVHEVGDEVFEFRPGDRVAAMHELRAPGGSYAEYSVSPASTTFHLPQNIMFEEAAAIPLASLTAAVALYARLGLRPPFLPYQDGASPPLVIYGASSAVGSYALQFAQRSNIHPVICIAGRSRSHVEQFLDPAKGDVVLDYREASDKLITGIRTSAGDTRLTLAFDAVSTKESSSTLARALDKEGSEIVYVLPPELSGLEAPPGIKTSYSNVKDCHHDLEDFGRVYTRLIASGLSGGWFKPQPHEVIPGGLNGIEDGLRKLKEGKANAVKYVFRIADTPLL